MHKMICFIKICVYFILITSVLLDTVYTQEDGSFWWLKVLKLPNKIVAPEIEMNTDSMENHILSNSTGNVTNTINDLENSINTVMDKSSIAEEGVKNDVWPKWSQDVHQNNIMLHNSGMIIDNLFDGETTEITTSEDRLFFPIDVEMRPSTECHCMTSLNCQRLRGDPENTRYIRKETCKNEQLDFVCCKLNSRNQLQNIVLSQAAVNTTVNDKLVAVNTNILSVIHSTTAAPELLNIKLNAADIPLNARMDTKPNISNIIFPRSSFDYPKHNITIKQNTTKKNMLSKSKIINVLHSVGASSKSTFQPNLSNVKTNTIFVQQTSLNVKTNTTPVQPNLPAVKEGTNIIFPKENASRKIVEFDVSTAETDLKLPDKKNRFKRTIFEKIPRIVTEYGATEPETQEDPYWNIKNANINPRLTLRNRNNSKSVDPGNEFNSHGNQNISEILTEIPKPGIGTITTPGFHNVWLNSNLSPRFINPSNKSASIVSTKGSNYYGQNYFDYSDEITKKPAFTLDELLNNLGGSKSSKPISNIYLSETVERVAEAFLEMLVNDSGIHETTSNQLDPDFIVFQNFLPWRRQLIAKVKQEIQSLKYSDFGKNNPAVVKSPNKLTTNRTPSFDDISDDQIKQIFAGYGQTPEDETPISNPDDINDAVYEDYEVEPPTTEFLNQIYPKCGTLDDSSGTSQSPWLLRVSVDGDRAGLRAEVRSADDRAELRGGASRVLCGGALVHPRAALVAAHCVVGSLDGTASLRTSPGADGSAAQERRARILAHASYRAGGVHDLALLLWRVPLQMGSGVKALCVPSGDSVAARGSPRCSSVGWNNRRPVFTTARVVSPSSCGATKTNARNPRAICADNGASCEQDLEIEGPLLCLTGQRWHITGLFSWRRSCSQPARYTDVAAHQAWLINLLEDNYLI